MQKIIFPLLIAVGSVISGLAFSPYEEFLQSGSPTYVALVAEVAETNAFRESVIKLGEAETAASLAAAMITDVQTFSRMIEGQHIAVIYFSYKGGSTYTAAVNAFESATKSIDWADSLTPHPRAERYGTTWLQTEWICHIRGKDVDQEPTARMLLGTEILPEKEMEYRLLHQSVWPGVTDQLIRSNYRNLSIFMVELDEQLVEFMYLEYVGENQSTDDKANQLDPCIGRWWKITDACQKPFSDVNEGIWALMAPVVTDTDEP